MEGVVLITVRFESFMDELLPPEHHASFMHPTIAQEPPLVMSTSDAKLGLSMEIGVG